MIIGLGLVQLLVGYGRISRQNLVQELITNQSRRSLRNLALGVRQSRRLEVSGDGQQLLLTLDNGDVQEWLLTEGELRRLWHENDEVTSTVTMLGNLAPTSRFTLVQRGTGSQPDLVEATLEVVKSQRDDVTTVVVLQARLATRVSRRIAIMGE